MVILCKKCRPLCAKPFWKLKVLLLLGEMKYKLNVIFDYVNKKEFFAHMKATKLCYFIMYLQFYSYSMLGCYAYILINDKNLNDVPLFIIPLIFTYLFEKIYEGHNGSYSKKVQEIELKNIQSLNTYLIFVMIILVLTSYNQIDILKYFRDTGLNFWIYALSAIITSFILLYIYSLSLTKLKEEKD